MIFGLDFSKYGIKAGIIKFGKIIAWYAASGALAGAVAILSNYKPSENQIFAVLAIMTANSVIAAVGKWLTTHKPQE